MMEHYKTPNAKLSGSDETRSLWLQLNNLALMAELILIVVPTAILFGLGSLAFFSPNFATPLSFVFLLLWISTVGAIAGLSLSLLAHVFRFDRLHRVWRILPSLGIIAVVVGFIFQQLPDPINYKEKQVKDGISYFVVGIVLFIPLVHLKLSEYHRYRAEQHS